MRPHRDITGLLSKELGEGPGQVRIILDNKDSFRGFLLRCWW